ncbi:MAG TPA: hypothetical protein VIT38_00885 [Allosphingosinicella sp.]
MRFALALLLAWLGAGAAAAQPPRLVEVAVTHDGARWTADFAFRARSRAWLLLRSPVARIGEQPWRPRSWTIETPGVRLERRGHWDVLTTSDGRPVPANVRIRFTPFSGDVLGDYDPALVFTDGSVALYSGQFTATPIGSAATAARLPGDLNEANLPETRTRIVFRDSAGPVMLAGRRQPAATVEGSDDGTYVLFGPIRPIVSESMAAVIDPQLPAWIRTSLGRSVPDILGRYAAALGPAPGPKPMVMVSWAGPTPGMTSMGGSVLDGLIVMAYEGSGVLEENARSRGSGLWFIAHESAHFWLGQAVHYDTARQSWITEGGADLLAIRTVAEVDPTYDWRGELQKEVDDCAALSAGRGIASALERNEYRAYYACGAVFALIAEAASRRPFTQFVRRLIETNRADRTVTRAEWLAALDQVSRDPSLSRDIGRMLDRGAAEPGAAIASLFTRAGVRFTPGPNGVPRLQ